VVTVPLQLPAQTVPSLLQAGRLPCGAPLGTVVQVPGVMSQAWHCPVQAWLQHTPSAQLSPVWHSADAVQTPPRGTRGMHWLPAQ
jgi:hypothetical protein